MSSINPYIFGAYYNWLVDNEITPHLFIRSNYAGVEVPPGYDRDGTMVLSIAPQSVEQLNINPRNISFYAMFKGVRHHVVVPYGAMQQLIALETKVAYPLYVWFIDQNSNDDDLLEVEDDDVVLDAPRFSRVDELPPEEDEESEDAMSKSPSGGEDKKGQAPTFSLVSDD